MATSKKFSELPAASSVGNGDLFAIAHEDALAETGYVSQKLTAAQAGQKVNGDTEYPTSLPSFPENGQNPFAALEKLNADIEALYPVNTASGSIANFTTSLVKPLTELTSTIVAQQASGTPTPSSPLPISGVSSVSFYQRGVNLWDEEWEAGSISDSTGLPTESTTRIRCKNFIPVKPNTTYYLVMPQAIRVYKYGISKESDYLSYSDVSLSGDHLFTTPNDCYFLKFRIGSTATPVTTYNNDISINYPSTDTSYHAYNANSDTFTIQLGETVYGGSADAKSGKASKTVKYFSFSEAQYYGTYGTDNANLYYVEIPDYETDKIKQMSSSSFDGILISNMMSKISDSSSRMKDNEIRTNAGANINTFYFRADQFADLTALNAFLAVTPLVVVAELQTPVEITDLTTDNFTTISGENNIFSDCGEVSVGYKQSVQEYIDAKIAETQALIL